MRRLDAIVQSPSKSFAAGAIAFCIGIVLGQWIDITWMNVVFSVLLVSGVLVVWMSDKRRVLVLFFTLFLLGLYRSIGVYGDVVETRAGDYAGADILIEGVIATEVEMHAGGVRFELDNVRIAEEPVGDRILVHAPGNIAYGDRVQFACALTTPEPIEDFDYPAYLASRGISAICFRPTELQIDPPQGFNLTRELLSLKGAILTCLTRILPEPHASFAGGLLFGGGSALSPELREDFTRTGTSHILAASGFNVSLFSLVLLGWILQTPLGRRRGLLLTCVLLVAYILMAGATPAVVRAGIMALVMLVGLGAQRKPSLLNMMLLAAALLLFIDPALVGDVGFQLSFVATGAVLFIAPRIEPWFTFIPETVQLRQALVGSLAAIVLTTPIVLWHFGTISLIAPFANLLILPLVPFLMALTILALLVSLLSTELALLVALPAWALSSVILHIITWYSAFTHASVSIGIAHTAAIVSAACLIIVLWLARPRVTQPA